MWHLTLATVGRVRLAPDDAATLRVVRATVRTTRPLLFAVVDDHGHAVVHGTRREASALASAWSRALAHAGCPALDPARIREVEGRSHLQRLIGYLLGQPAHHGLPWAPLAPGSCLPDLLGARQIGFDPAALASQLPRVDVGALALSAADLPPARIVLPSDELVRGLGAARVWSAALATAGVVEVNGQDALAVGLRTAFRHLGVGDGAREACGASLRTWQRLAHLPPDADLVQAIRRRIGLEAVVEAAGQRRAGQAPLRR